MKERLITGAETFVEDQKLLYAVMYLGLKHALSALRSPEAVGDTVLSTPEPVVEPSTKMREDEIYYLQAA